MIQKLRKNLTVGLAALLSVVMVSGNSASALDLASAKEYIVNKANDVTYFVGNQTEAFKKDPLEYLLCTVVAKDANIFLGLNDLRKEGWKNFIGWSNIKNISKRVAPCVAYKSVKFYLWSVYEKAYFKDLSKAFLNTFSKPDIKDRLVRLAETGRSPYDIANKAVNEIINEMEQ